MSTTVRIVHIEKDFPITQLDNRQWQKAGVTEIGRYWSGETAPVGRQAKARILWSATALYVRFEANQAEPLVISDEPILAKKTLRLWDRDVCEIFIAPNKSEPRKYFEFEIAPNGEWIDLAIDLTSGKRVTDWDYASGMESFAKIEKDKIWMVIKIEWRAFGKTPAAGDVWFGNIFRCVGEGATRGYLAWSPTETETPAFHVPVKFGAFEFVK